MSKKKNNLDIRIRNNQDAYNDGQKAVNDLTSIFSNYFNGPKDSVDLNVISTITTSVSGFIISDKFKDKTDDERVDMVWDLLKTHPDEKKHLSMVYVLTPEEKDDLSS